jgi:hypothetical protein
MHRLTSLEKAELAGITVVIALSWFAPGFSLRTGGLITAASLLLLLQGFCRDIWLWRAARRNPSTEPPRHAACMCVESTIGFTGILAAAGLTAFRFGPLYSVIQPWLTLGVAAVLSAGFLLKDFVFTWSPWRIYREKDHATLHFRWRQ